VASHRSTVALAVTAMLLAAPTRGALAARDEATPDFTTPAPAALEEIRVEERLGAKVPLELRFRDHAGRQRTLGELVRGDLPVILTFNYSDCPMLCSLQLNGFVAALPAMSLRAGAQFRIVTVVLDPQEEPTRAAETREAYLGKLDAGQAGLRASAERDDGWTFLVADRPGDGAAIRRLAESVGFGYRYVTERGEWAHPATLVFLSASGMVTRYVHGIQYEQGVLDVSVMKAGIAEPSAAAGFLQRCFHYNPDANSQVAAGVSLMRYGAAAFASLVVGGLILAHLLRRSGRSLPLRRSSSGGVART
jgi:protein SCO1/2